MIDDAFTGHFVKSELHITTPFLEHFNHCKPPPSPPGPIPATLGPHLHIAIETTTA
jgi:hypothetical protein